MLKQKILKKTLLLTVALLTFITPSRVNAASISLHLNGVAPVVYTEENNGEITVPETVVDFDGMTFKGWNTQANGKGEMHQAGDKLSANTTLYAQWADGTHVDISGENDNPSNPNSNPDQNADRNPNPVPTPNGADPQNGNNATNQTVGNIGAPTAGFFSSGIKLAAPLGFIVAGAMASWVVIVLTRRESKLRKQSILFTLYQHRKYFGLLGVSIIVLTGGVFFLTRVTSDAATGDVVHNGFFTVNGNTTWWRGGIQQAGETVRRGNWYFFDPTDNKYMAKGRDVYHAEDKKWVRYGEDGAMVKGEDEKDGEWWYFDPTTGAMAKGLTSLPDGRTVYYDQTDGHMLKGWHDIDGTSYHLNEDDGSLYPFYVDGKGGGEIHTAFGAAQLAVRLATTADGYSNPILVGSANVWDTINTPSAQEYIRITDEVSKKYDDPTTNDDGTNYAYASCTQAVGHIVRATIDPDINNATTESMRAYLDNSKSKWQYMGNLGANESLNSGRLKPGDILTTEQNVHTIMYIGNDLVRREYPNSTANIIEADYSIGQWPHLATHNTYPRANGDTFRIYRFTGQLPTNTLYPYINAWRFLAK